MATDDESTRLVDLAAATDEHESLGEIPRLHGNDAGAEELLDSGGPFPVTHPASSITRVNVAPPPLTPRMPPSLHPLHPASVTSPDLPAAMPVEPDDAPPHTAPSTTTRTETSLPGTLPAADIAQALALAMVSRSDRLDRFAEIDDSALTVANSDEPMSDEPETATRLPFPAAWSGGGPGPESDSDSTLAVLRSPFAPTRNGEATLAGAPIEATLAGAAAPAPADDEIEAEELDPDEVLEADDLVSEPELEDPDASLDEHLDRLEAEDDLDRTGDLASAQDAAAPSLPRYSYTSHSEIVVSPSSADVQVVSQPVASASSVFTSAPELGDVYEQEGDETLFQKNPPLPAPAPATKRTPPPVPLARPSAAPGPSYQPPAPVGKQTLPAYEVDTDDDEEHLLAEKSYRALLDLHRLRLADAATASAKATLLHKIASVHEYQLGEPQRAFELLVEAFDVRPNDDDIVASLERVARSVGRVGEIADRARKNLHTTDLALKIILLGHLVYWYERLLGRGGETALFVSELERLDKTHPVILRRSAQEAAANGDVKTQRDLLLRALDRVTRRDEKVATYLALAGAYAGTADALRYYEAAVANDATAIVALQGIEHLGREKNNHAQVEWSLERQVEVAPTGVERIDALLKLAELYERKFLKRERAAEILERVIQIEPAHPHALKALERCYHALRDWPRLVRILRHRAASSFDPKQRIELLELAAEVYESKSNDLQAAIDVHRDILGVDPKHRRALGDLARLHEKLGDWGNMSTYKSRLADLSPSKRQASQLLVQLGDFLNTPERDPVAARIQYERAVTVDPTNAGAWEALQRVAAEAGDDRRVAQCLEERANAVDGPRQRAALYVELGNLYSSNRDDASARDAFEKATLADPTNESAALAMLDVFSREERWKEAAPLCDLLVNAATRDKDLRTLFTRLRLSTRIAAALGDADKAMGSALGALDLQPDDEAAQADLIAVCTQCRSQPRVVARAKEPLTRIAATATDVPTNALLTLAELQRAAGEADIAIATLERAHDKDPDNEEAQRELAEAYLQLEDYPRACALRLALARNAIDPNARFQQLCDVGDIYARRAGALEQAAPVFEEARALRPLDHWLLHTLMWLYGELGRWDDLSNVLENIAQIQESSDRKAKSFFAMAQVLKDKVGDPARAAQMFDQVLDLDPTRLDAFELLVRGLTEVKDWERLELFYRKMIARTKGVASEANEKLEFVLFRQLGLIYRDRLEDVARAFEALEYAASLRPDDAEVRKIVTELLVVTDNLDTAVLRTRELIKREPHDAELYAELYELFLRQHDFDKAWCAVNVLAQMREPTPEQRRFHEDYAPMPLSDVPGQIVEQAWRSHVFHVDLDPTLTNLFSRMAPAVARMRLAQLRPEQQAYAAGRPFMPQHSRLYDAIRMTFANAAEILQLPPPDLLLGDPSAPVPFAPALVPFGAVHVGVPAVEARADALVYVIGKRLAEQRPELIARAFFPSTSDLAALLGAAVRVSRQERANDAAAAALDASLAAHLMPHEREAMHAIVMEAAMQGSLVDVKRWSQAADLSSMRAGLLLAGDVGQARRSILAEPQSTADLPPREKIGELYQFATSDLLSDLREAIGVAVRG